MFQYTSSCTLNKLKEIYEKFFPFTKRNILIKFISKHANTILDLGCGSGQPFKHITTYRSFFFSCGLDIEISNIKNVKKNGLYDSYVIGDARYVPFKIKSFDVIICLEVIEHLTKKEGTHLLKTLNNLSKITIISTPSFYYQIPNFLYHQHLSYYSKKELNKYGYIVRGSRVKALFYNDKINGQLGRIILAPVTYFFPNLASSFIAIKEM